MNLLTDGLKRVFLHFKLRLEQLLLEFSFADFLVVQELTLSLDKAQQYKKNEKAKEQDKGTSGEDGEDYALFVGVHGLGSLKRSGFHVSFI
jgi:hypothetical protein